MVRILDTTLREGEQTPGVYFDAHVKLAIADYLERLGIDYLEAGHPAVSEEIEEVVRHMSSRHANLTVAAHSRNLREDVDRAIDCGAGFIGIFYCVSNDRLNGVFGKSLDHAIEQISGVIEYAKTREPNVIIRYTPEDTVRSDFGNVLRAAVAAVRAGADIISIADTTGHMVPGTDRSMFEFVRKIKGELESQGLGPMIAVHCHNDRGLALANALDGYRAGADIIDASVLGLGERAGIVDLAQLLVTLAADFPEENGNRWDLELLPEIYELVSRYSRIPIPSNFPITGANAFTHCAGMHTHAVTKDPRHYHSLDPSMVGRTTEICLDHMSGSASIKHALGRLGIHADNGIVDSVTAHVKDVGRKGRTVNEEELVFIADMYLDNRLLHNANQPKTRERPRTIRIPQNVMSENEISTGPPMYR